MDIPLRVALTPGEPAGIGPDLCVQLAQIPQAAELVAVCDPELLATRARQLDLDLQLVEHQPGNPPLAHVAGQLKVLPVAMPGAARCGHPQTGHARYVLRTLDAAVRGCEQNTFAAMVTGPVHKEVINAAGIPFTGHTEYLAKQTGTGQVVMMLVAPGIRVALVTTHVPLQDVPAAITDERLSSVLRILHRELPQRMGIPDPRILVCGLNPHAGEGGHLGSEENDIIRPLLDRLRGQGLNLTGPLPADTAFTPNQLLQGDVVLAMYHDQGLPVLKHLGFGRAVNITLGLPVLRTSVDHGTALELAGTGNADTGSMQAAVDAAIRMAAPADRH